MSLTERVRIVSAVWAYDFWLDWRHVPRRARRDLRRELSANLTAAAAEVGAREAVRRLDGIRQLADDTAAIDTTRARWSAGCVMALAVAAVLVVVEVFAALLWADGAATAAPTATVRGSMPFFPGSSVTYAPSATGFAISVDLGWLWLAAALLTILAVARPWRVLRRRQAGPDARS